MVHGTSIARVIHKLNVIFQKHLFNEIGRLPTSPDTKRIDRKLTENIKNIQISAKIYKSRMQIESTNTKTPIDNSQFTVRGRPR